MNNEPTMQHKNPVWREGAKVRVSDRRDSKHWHCLRKASHVWSNTTQKWRSSLAMIKSLQEEGTHWTGAPAESRHHHGIEESEIKLERMKQFFNCLSVGAVLQTMEHFPPHLFYPFQVKWLVNILACLRFFGILSICLKFVASPCKITDLSEAFA